MYIQGLPYNTFMWKYLCISVLDKPLYIFVKTNKVSIEYFSIETCLTFDDIRAVHMFRRVICVRDVTEVYSSSSGVNCVEFRDQDCRFCVFTVFICGFYNL